MPDYAYEISKWAVQELVNKVNAATKEEAEEWQIVESDIVFMKQEFEMMRSFLESADDGERFWSNMAKTWVRQVRDLSYGAEDCIEFVLHLETKWSFRSFCLRLIPSWLTGGAVPPLTKAVAEIKQLKAMVEEVSKRSMRYNLVTVSESKQVAQMQLAPAASPLDTILSPSDTEKDEEADEELIERLTAKDKVLRVFSICGTGGDLGILSIARKAYHSSETCSNFKLRAWVKLMPPFNPYQFIQSLLRQFQANSCKEGEDICKRMVIPKKNLVNKFAEQIKNTKYFIVLEDLSSMAEWEAIKVYLPETNNGSRVIVLTQQLEFASQCVGEPPEPLKLREFSHDHTIYVFYKEDDESELDEEPEPNQLEASASEEPITDSELEKLMAMVTSQGWRDKHHVVAVCGMAGVERSRLVKTFYDRCLDKRLFDDYGWVHVPDSFNITEFRRRLSWFLVAGERSYEAMFVDGDLYRLRYGKSLIVIEGLQSADYWNSIREGLELHRYSTCVILVTSDENLARDCATENDVFNVGVREENTPLGHPENQGDVEQIRPGWTGRLQEAYDWLKKSKPLVGRHSEVERIYRRITSPDRMDEHRVVSVCGIAGAGKSFLLKNIYYKCIQRELREDLFGYYGLVKIPDRFDPMEFYQRLVLDLTGYDRDGKDKLTPCRSALHEMQRVLVVIDGLQSTEHWDSIKDQLDLPASRSCIVVATRDLRVARYCASTPDDVCVIKGLQPNAALRLVRDQLLEKLGTSNSDLLEIENEALAIMNKCGRIPKVVKALRTYLKSIKKPTAEKMTTQLRNLSGNFVNELQRNKKPEGLREVFDSMHSRFRACHQVLKKCCFYLLIFPESSHIRRSRLVSRWIAEGYSEGIDSNSMVMYAEKLFHELDDLGMIAKPAETTSMDSETTMSSCQVNSLFLEYITFKEREERIFLPLEVYVLERECFPSTGQVGQHLAIRDWKGDEASFGCLNFTQLRSLTVSGEWQSFFVSKMMKVLRVLDLEGTSNLNNKDLEQIVKLLKRLKFLSLRGCKEVSKLPRSLGKLRQLQTLDVRGTKVEKLPKSIVKLKKLQCIRAGRMRSEFCDLGVTVPQTEAAAPVRTVEQQQPPTSMAKPTIPANTEEEQQPPSAQAGPAVPASAEEQQQPPTSEAKSTVPESIEKVQQSPRVSARTQKRQAQGPQPNRGVSSVSVQVPRRIRKLAALHTLGIVNVNTIYGKAIFEELSKLSQLRKLGVSGTSSQLSMFSGLGCFSLPLLQCVCNLGMCGKSRGIQQLSRLESLSLHIQKDNHAGGVAAIKLPKNLKSLKLYGEVQKLPRSISCLTNLKKFNLEMVELTQDDIRVLGGLKELHTLRLRFQKLGARESWLEISGGQNYGKLQVLDIACTCWLPVIFGEGAMEKLELFVLRSTPALQLWVPGLEDLVSLNKVSLRGSYNDTLKAALQRQFANHRNKDILSLD
ncbi:hypothetical protein ACP4OV_008896 [Aristida adscensionis]